MKNLGFAILLLLLPSLTFAGASATVSNYISPGYFMGSMNNDIVPGNVQQFYYKIHTGNLAFIVVEDAFGGEARCSVSGTGELAEDLYNTLAHLKDGTLLILYHDQATNANVGNCTGFVMYSDTRFQTER